MKLYAPQFFRSLRRRVRREVKTRPEWRKAARQARGGNGLPGALAVRWAVPFLALIPALREPSSPLLWLVFALWALVMACFRAGQAQTLAAWQEGVNVFVQLPVSDRDVLGYIRGRVLRTSCWLLFDALVVVSLACAVAGVRPAAWLCVLPVALLLWGSALAMAVVLLWLRPRADYAAWGSMLLYGAFVGGMVLRNTHALTPERVETTAAILSWAMPPGWALQFAAWFVGAGAPFPFAALGLLALFFAGAVSCYRALGEQFVFWEPEALPFQNAEEDEDEASEPPVESRASEVEERIGTRAFLVPLGNGDPGWIERRIFSALRRQAAVLDFLVGSEPGWSARFRYGLLTLLATPLLAWLAAQANETVGAWLLGMGLFSGLAFSTPLFGGAWRGFDLGPMGHRFIAVLSLLPVGFCEIRRVVLAVNALRFLLALPCWLAAGWLVSRASGQPPFTGLRWAAELWLVLLLLQPFFLVFAFSRGTNDTASGCLNSAVFFLGMLLTVAVCGGALVAIFTDPAWPWQVAALLVLAASSFAFEATYRWLYHGQRFDLLAKANSAQ